MRGAFFYSPGFEKPAPRPSSQHYAAHGKAGAQTAPQTLSKPL